MAKVKVKLAADCHVDNEVRKAGEIAELPEEIADSFGEVVKEEKAPKQAADSDKK